MPFKEQAQNLLRSVGVYERARESWIYDAYWNVFDSHIIEDRRKEASFYRTLLEGFREGDLIYDVGANQGYKTGIFLSLGARVVAVEPDESCQTILKQRFLTFRLRKKPLTIVGKAAGEKCSTQKMWIDVPGSAKNTLSQKWAETLRKDDTRFGQPLEFGHWKEVETTTIEQLCVTHGPPFFVKIDVEGYEPSVLRGMQRPVPYLSFEVNLPEFRAEGLECIQLLARLAREGQFNYTPDCRRGLALKCWSGAEEFSAVLRSCTDKSIEIFWKTPQRGR